MKEKTVEILKKKTEKAAITELHRGRAEKVWQNNERSRGPQGCGVSGSPSDIPACSGGALLGQFFNLSCWVL